MKNKKPNFGLISFGGETFEASNIQFSFVDPVQITLRDYINAKVAVFDDMTERGFKLNLITGIYYPAQPEEIDASGVYWPL